jgi:protein-disulfide isomerase-like protein with CxxC motif
MAESYLEEIRDELRDGFNRATPVKIDNLDAVKAAFVAGALAAQASDAGAAIQGRHFEEGIDFYMAMNGLE